MYVMWDITKKCNLNCISCYNRDRYTDRKYDVGRELDTSESIYAIKILSKSSISSIHLLGGELFMRRDLFEIIKHIKNSGLRVSINTNGTLLNENICKKLIEEKVNGITFSLDGSSPEINDVIRGKGTFERAVKNIKILTSLIKENNSKLDVSIAVTMNKLNLFQLSSMVDLAVSLGVPSIVFMDLYLSGNALNNAELLKYNIREEVSALDKLAANLKKDTPCSIQIDSYRCLTDYLKDRYNVNIIVKPRNMGCDAGSEVCFIQADGQVMPCGMCNHSIYSPLPRREKCYTFEKLKITDVNSLDEILNSNFFKSFLKFKEQSYFNKPNTCIRCPSQMICTPCPILQYKKSSIQECEEVLQITDSFYNSFLKKTVIVSKKAVYSTEQGKLKVYDKNLKIFRTVNDIAADIFFSLLNRPQQVIEIIEEISRNYRNSPPKSLLVRQVVKFLLELNKIEIVNFHIM